MTPVTLPQLSIDGARNGEWVARLQAARKCGRVNGGWVSVAPQSESELRFTQDGAAVDEEQFMASFGYAHYWQHWEQAKPARFYFDSSAGGCRLGDGVTIPEGEASEQSDARRAVRRKKELKNALLKTCCSKQPAHNHTAQFALLKPHCSNRTAQTALLKPHCSNRTAQTALLKPHCSLFSPPDVCGLFTRCVWPLLLKLASLVQDRVRTEVG